MSNAQVGDDAIDEPLPTDIICGQGNLHHHKGNQTFRRVIDEHTDGYHNATSETGEVKVNSKTEKRRIVCRIYDKLCRDDKVRFVERDASTKNWTIVRISKRIKSKIRQRLCDARNPNKSGPGHWHKKHNKQKEEKPIDPHQLQTVALPDHSQSGFHDDMIQRLSDVVHVDPFNSEIFYQAPPSAKPMEESKKRLIANIMNDLLQKNPGLA